MPCYIQHHGVYEFCIPGTVLSFLVVVDQIRVLFMLAASIDCYSHLLPFSDPSAPTLSAQLEVLKDLIDGQPRLT